MLTRLAHDAGQSSSKGDSAMPADNAGEPRDRSLDERPTTRWTVVVALPVGDSRSDFWTAAARSSGALRCRAPPAGPFIGSRGLPQGSRGAPSPRSSTGAPRDRLVRQRLGGLRRHISTSVRPLTSGTNFSCGSISGFQCPLSGRDSCGSICAALDHTPITRGAIVLSK